MEPAGEAGGAVRGGAESVEGSVHSVPGRAASWAALRLRRVAVRSHSVAGELKCGVLEDTSAMAPARGTGPEGFVMQCEQVTGKS